MHGWTAGPTRKHWIREKLVANMPAPDIGKGSIMIEAKLAELGITFPAPAAPVASYVPAVEANGMLFISGQLPFVDGKVMTGKVGDTRNLEDG